MRFGQTALQESARVHAGRSMPLEIDDVSGVISGFGPEKMVEAKVEIKKEGGKDKKAGQAEPMKPGILIE